MKGTEKSRSDHVAKQCHSNACQFMICVCDQSEQKQRCRLILGCDCSLMVLCRDLFWDAAEQQTVADTVLAVYGTWFYLKRNIFLLNLYFSSSFSPMTYYINLPLTAPSKLTLFIKRRIKVGFLNIRVDCRKKHYIITLWIWYNIFISYTEEMNDPSGIDKAL